MICSGLDAPIQHWSHPHLSGSSLVPSVQGCPLSPAILFRASICTKKLFFRQCIGMARNLPSHRNRLSDGIPCRYLSVRSPCASGLKCNDSFPIWFAVFFKPFCSIVRSKMEYRFWLMTNGHFRIFQNLRCTYHCRTIIVRNSDIKCLPTLFTMESSAPMVSSGGVFRIHSVMIRRYLHNPAPFSSSSGPRLDRYFLLPPVPRSPATYHSLP